MGIVWEVIGEGDMEKVRRQFPDEFAPLFIDAE